MRNNSRKILIIVIIIIAVLAIAGAMLAYLMLATDTFKSNQELFAKYISQNLDSFGNMKKSSTKDIYNELENQNAYESNAEISIKYSEGGEISNPFNDLSAKFVTQVDNQNEYLYRDAQILFKDEEYLEFETIREQDISGIRFSDVTKQFIGVKNTENLLEIAEDLGVDVNDLENFVRLINGEETLKNQLITDEEINIIKNNYMDIIKTNLANASYTKLKKAMITVNNNTIQTNSYTATLNSQQVQNMIIQFLNTIKNDQIILQKISSISGKQPLNNIDDSTNINIEDLFVQYIDGIIEKVNDYEKDFPEIKITVYEKNGITVRTSLEMGTNEINIENSEENGQQKIQIQMKKANSEKEQGTTIEILKNSNQNSEVYNINIYLIDGEETQEIQITSQMQNTNNQINRKIEIKYIEGIKEITFTINNVTNIGEIGEEKQKLEENNNVILNDLNEEGRKHIINVLIENVPQKFDIRMNLLTKALGLESEPEVPQENPSGEYEMTQVEINRFNAKFEFYTGESVTAQNVLTLLDVVKSNLASVQVTTDEVDENTAPNSDVKETIRLNIEKDKENASLIEPIKEKIEDRQKYKVSIFYKELNNMIDYIIISEMD